MFNVKIIVLIVGISFLFTSIPPYACAESKDTLRVPVGVKEERAENLTFQIFLSLTQRQLTERETAQYIRDRKRRDGNVLILNLGDMEFEVTRASELDESSMGYPEAPNLYSVYELQATERIDEYPRFTHVLVFSPMVMGGRKVSKGEEDAKQEYGKLLRIFPQFRTKAQKKRLQELTRTVRGFPKFRSGSPDACLETLLTAMFVDDAGEAKTFRDSVFCTRDVYKARKAAAEMEQTTVGLELRYLVGVGILRRIKVGYYEFTEFTDKQLAYIRAIAPELQLPDMGEEVMKKVKEKIDNEIQDLAKLEDEVVFFFGKEITADRQIFERAFRKLPSNNRAIVLVENDTEKAPLELILDELGILKGSYEIMTFEQAGLIKAGVTSANIDSYLMQVLGIDNIHCLPLTPTKLELHPELEEVRRGV